VSEHGRCPRIGQNTISAKHDQREHDQRGTRSARTRAVRNSDTTRRPDESLARTRHEHKRGVRARRSRAPRSRARRSRAPRLDSADRAVAASETTAKVTYDQELLNELVSMRFVEAHQHVTVVALSGSARPSSRMHSATLRAAQVLRARRPDRQAAQDAQARSPRSLARDRNCASWSPATLHRRLRPRRDGCNREP